MTGTYNYVTVDNSISREIVLDESIYPSNTLFYIDLSNATNNVTFLYDGILKPLTFGTEYVFVIGSSVGSGAELLFDVSNGENPYYGTITANGATKALRNISTITFDYDVSNTHVGAKITLLSVAEDYISSIIHTTGLAAGVTLA